MSAIAPSSAILLLGTRRTLRAAILLDHALTLPPTEALTVAGEIVQMGEELSLPGTALAGQIRDSVCARR